ncbi:related to FG-GAP repeat protein [Fusarium oxysporum]|uniref:Related to FG-GAP repeat protein n=1 Tax=Fusarium oxysporum TaxID=5507 RepID=A0A2H3TJU3_FUSOX|nr:related to FG-GAP repeat protein [Fusarium oxysporum]
MAYQKRIVATGTAFNIENNGVRTFADVDGNGTQDLIYIKTRNTDTNKIEVHTLMQDYTGDGKADLIYIKTRNTGTRKIEVYVADAASRYQRFVLQTGTVFDIEDNGVWTMSAKGDLMYIKICNTGTGKIEYYVASKESRYQSFTKQVSTDFAVEDNGTWCLALRIGSGQFADLYYIKIRNTGTNMVEAHAVSAQSEFKARLIDTGTGFNLEDNGTWLMTNHLGDPQRAPDLTYIKTRATGTNKIEVHINEA